MAVEQALARHGAALRGTRWTLRGPGDRPLDARHERPAPAARRRPRPRLDQGRRRHRRGHRRRAGPAAPASSASAWSAATGIRRGVVRDIEETTRAIDKAMKSAQRMAGVEVGSVYCGIAGRARGRPQLARHGVGHRRRDPHQRRRPGQRHGEQHQLRAGPRAAARHSAGLPDRPAGRDQRADRDDRLAARGRGLPGHRALERARRICGSASSGRATTSGSSCSSRWPPRWRCSRRTRSSWAAPSWSWAAARPTCRSSTTGRSGTPARCSAPAGTSPRHRARAAGDAARRRAAQGALRRGLRAAGARERRLRAAQHAGPGRRATPSAGCWRTSCTCGCRKSWSTRSTRSRAQGIISACPPVSS